MRTRVSLSILFLCLAEVVVWSAPFLGTHHLPEAKDYITRETSTFKQLQKDGGILNDRDGRHVTSQAKSVPVDSEGDDKSTINTQFAQTGGTIVAPKSDEPQVSKDGYCTMTQSPLSAYPSKDNVPAKNKTSQHLTQCGQFFGDKVCCNAFQTENMMTRSAPFFNGMFHCPDCYTNFLRFWCEFTCSPNQSTFLKINDTLVVGKTVYAKSVVYSVDEGTAKGVYESCANVKQGLVSGATIFDVFFGVKASSYVDFYRLLGAASNQLGGVRVYFNLVNGTNTNSTNTTLADGDDSGSTPMYFPTGNCKDTCSCNDCPAACPKPPPEIPPNHHYIFGKIKYLQFFSAIGFFLFCLITVGVTAHCAYFAKRSAAGAGYAKITQDSSSSFEEEDNNYNNKSINDAEENGKHPNGYEEIDSSKSATTNFLGGFFRRFGWVIGRFPILVILASVVVVGVLAVGIPRIVIETHPEQLWVPPNSLAAEQKAYFDEHFGPFYRIEQLIITAKDGAGSLKRLLEGEEGKRNLLAILDIQNAITKITAERTTANGTRTITFEDVCFKPVAGKGCLIQSALGYWQSDRLKLLQDDDYLNKLLSCTKNPYSPLAGCLNSIGVPDMPNVVFGGFEGKEYTNATAIIITFLATNHVTDEENEDAALWEQELLNLLESKPLYPYGFDVAFSTQRSLQDELSRETSTDIVTVVISYAIMFLYVAVALGSFRSPFGVHTKFLLGLWGVLMVLMALVMALGVAGFAGIHATLIISEVIPFLVLAIGVDNIFILVETFQSTDSSLPAPDRMAATMEKVGTSITMASMSEALAFLLGILTRMPAVVAFSMYSSLAILFDYLLQITCFCAMMAIDARRTNANRIDCVPCFRRKVEESWQSRETQKAKEEAGIIRSIFHKFYAPFILHPVVKFVAVILFVGIFVMSVNVVGNGVPQGLEQQIALPQDSYLQAYFDEQADLFKVGAPVYWVVKKPFNYSAIELQNKLCALGAGVDGCSADSLRNKLGAEALIPDRSYLNGAISSWLDTYIEWLHATRTCCRKYKGTPTFEFCPPEEPDKDKCEPCIDPEELTKLEIRLGRPPPQQFYDLFPIFLRSECSTKCALCGEGFQGDTTYFDANGHNLALPVNGSRLGLNVTVGATRFMGYHTTLRNQKEFIDALKSARSIADTLKSNLDIEVFPYSVFYIFFEQYLYINNVTLMCLGLALAAVFVVTLVLMGNVTMSLMVTLMMAMIEVDIIAIVSLWGVHLNAVSVVNLVMAIGISVEFCVHIANSFMAQVGTRQARAHKALVDMGSAVFKGITITKFLGVVVLAFANSDIFRVYYFRMYFMIVIVGATHGLLFWPIVLSLMGPNTKKKVCSFF